MKSLKKINEKKGAWLKIARIGIFLLLFAIITNLQIIAPPPLSTALQFEYILPLNLNVW